MSDRLHRPLLDPPLGKLTEYFKLESKTEIGWESFTKNNKIAPTSNFREPYFVKSLPNFSHKAVLSLLPKIVTEKEYCVIHFKRHSFTMSAILFYLFSFANCVEIDKFFCRIQKSDKNLYNWPKILSKNRSKFKKQHWYRKNIIGKGRANIWRYVGSGFNYF